MAVPMTIGEVAETAGVSSSAIRYYERHGLLPEPIRVGGKRRYDAEVLERLAALRVAKQASFSLEDIRLLFDATDRGVPAHKQLKELATRKLPEIDALIAHAEEVRRWLQAADGCTCDTLSECELFEGGLRVQSFDADRDGE